jgi:hypothetical protein
MTIRRRILGAVFAAALVGAAMAPAAVASPPDPFLGAYQSVDGFDGSNQTVSFGGHGDTRRVTLFDDNATGGLCPEAGPAWATGIGEVSGDTLTIPEFEVVCASGETAVLPFSFTDEGDGTLTDSGPGGTIWHRP